MNIILADNQDITRAGLLYVFEQIGVENVVTATDKAALLDKLRDNPCSVVILDYTLFDFSGDSELLILGERFKNAFLVLFSEELSLDFVRRMVGTSLSVSVLLKESPMSEITDCLKQALAHKRYICQRMLEMMLVPANTLESKVPLTKTETEILRDIALGMTTKEIAEKRFSSFHTVNTHRKNIFRKIEVNNVHEATKYAIKSGLVDTADYYI
ncbi:MAG: response regulator transcription factor [Prevotella sp.]|nr:response regulator transcription factor [Prevotella sp.]MDY2703971.1 response regulator transcription factor [Prevotella sp.]